MKNKLLFCSFLALVLFSCNPSDDNGSSITDEQFAENFGPSVSRDFIGQIVDNDNHAISGATVSIGSQSVQTDANGIFILNDASVHEKFAFVKVTKTGFIDGSRAMVPTSGKNNVKIMLIPITPVATVSSGETTDVDLPNGTKVTFDGAFQTEDGASYTGDVNVSMYHLETSNENLQYLMPGMLYAKGEDNQPKVLETFGMLNVELRGSAGQKLQIKSGHNAGISMKIDDSQMATAPQSIPIWHFDETVGYWKQEGTATKQGNAYVGEVSHFSWWNCDQFDTPAFVNITLTNSDGVALANVGVGLDATGLQSAMQITDQNGQVNGAVPAGQTLMMKIYDTCGNITFSQQIGPFSGNASQNVVIDSSEALSTVVSGKLVTCDGGVVENGYVCMENGMRTSFAILSEGNFTFTTLVCGPDENFDLIGYDADNVQTTGRLSYAFNEGNTNVGSLPVCSAIDEFLVYTVDNMPANFIYGNIQTQFDNSFALSIFGDVGEGKRLIIDGYTTQPGVYTGSEFRFNCDQYYPALDYVHTRSFWNENNLPGVATVHLNKFGAVGDYIDVTFSITANSSSGPITLEGYAHVKRDN
ncbi:hypothetical protein FLLO111716_01930 [Flavobacterium longum]|uniref:hypothetical protein n=1 Tax=Flavobacterium longum TaxID=1299340 RepID=UPI0039E87787